MRKVLLSGLILLTMGIVSAQQTNVKFTTKTPFTVGNGHLPAGTYQIRPIDNEGTFECAASAGAPSVLFEADVMEAIPTTTDITFAKYGDKMVLKGFSVAGVQGYTIPLSLHEKQHKKAGLKPAKVSAAAAKQ